MSATSPIPGKPGYEYGRDGSRTGIFRWVGKDDPELKPVLPWYPKVTRYIVTKNSKEKITEARYTISVDGHEDTVTAEELSEASTWAKWPGAVGIHDRTMRDCLANIVQAEARKLPQTIGGAYWSGDQLVMPEADLLPRGYGQKADHGELGELVRVAIENPKVALMMGFSYGSPYIGPLKRQSFWVAPSGDSSKGKTSSFLAAAAMHGYSPKKGGVIRPWNATGVAINIQLGELAVLPAFWDEIHMVGFTPSVLKKTIHTTCDGADRLVAGRNRKLKEASMWSGVLFSTGNISVTGWCPQPEVACRVVEIPTPIVAGRDDAKALEYLTERNHGWWKPIPVDQFRDLIRYAEQKIGVPDDGGVTERIVENLALGVAGALVIGGPEMADAALEAAQALLTTQVDELADSGVRPSARLLEELRQALVARPFKFPTEQTYKEWTNGDRAAHGLVVEGFRLDAGRVWVLSKYMDQLARDAGLENARIALREMKDSRVLVTGTEKGERLRKRPRVAGERFDVYELDLALAEFLENEEMTGTTGTTGTGYGVSAGGPALEGWPKVVPVVVPVPVATGTTGTGTGTTGTGTSMRTATKVLVRAGLLADVRPFPAPVPVPVDRDQGETGVVPVVPVVVPVASGTGTGTGTGHAGTVTSEDEAGGPGGPGGPGRIVTPMERKRSQRVVNEVEHLAHFAKAVQGKDPSKGRYPNATEAELIAGMRTFTVAMGGLNFAGPPSRVGQLLFERCEAQYGSVPVLGATPELPTFDQTPVTMFNMVQRDRAVDVDTHPLVVAYDVNAQFLGVTQSVTLGTGSPDHLPGVMFLKGESKELKKAGYVRLATEVVMGPGKRLSAGTWVANPVAEYLVERDGSLEVTERYLWGEGRRWLSAWGKSAGAGRRALVVRNDPASRMALTALKLVYSTFLGGYLRSERYNTNETLRPDWADQLQSLARMNMLRGIARTRPKPIATYADAAYFLLREDQAVTGLGIDEETFQPGKWKRAAVGDSQAVAVLSRPGGKATETTLKAQLEAGSTGGIAAVVKALGEGRTAKVASA